MTPSSSKSFVEAGRCGEPQHPPLHDAKDLDAAVQRLRYFAFLEHNGNLWYPLVILMENLSCTADGFYKRVQLAALEGSQVSLTIAHHGFGVDPRACFKYCSNLIFPCTHFFPASNFLYVTAKACDNSGFVLEKIKLTFHPRRSRPKSISTEDSRSAFCPHTHLSESRPIIRLH